MADIDSRTAPRKVLRVRVKIVTQGAKALVGRTLDISLLGLGAMIEEPLPVGQACMIMMDLLVDGISRQFHAEARVVYSICSGTAGFRTGFQFFQLSAGNKALVNALPG